MIFFILITCLVDNVLNTAGSEKVDEFEKIVWKTYNENWWLKMF